MFQDLKIGFRMLRRTPGFTLLAILCLTLGIGATTAVFSWIEGILLRPYPLVQHQDRMFAMTGMDPTGRTDVSWPDFKDLERNSTLAQSFIAEHIMGATLNIGDRSDRATGSVVSANYFEALGMKPMLGRTFTPDEEVGSQAHPVTVISYDCWKSRYQSDPDIIGKKQRLDGVYHTIIGVMPEGFSGTFVGYTFQFWVPASMEETFEGGGYKLENRGARWSEGFVFLKPGVTIEQAQTEISAIGGRLQAAYPDTNRGRNFQLYPLWLTPFNNARTLGPTLRISLVVACLVLLIACANVGNLMLVRAFTRRHEMTVRLSVGARRMRLVRQLLTEGLLLSAAAAGCGLMLAYWCRDLMKLAFPPPAAGVVINLPADMDWRVLALSTGVCLIATVLFGLVPGLQASNVDLAAAMKSESGSVVGGRGKAWIRSALVLVQVSLSFLLLVGAGLLLKSFQAIEQSDPGFSTSGVMLSSIDMIAAGYNPVRIRNFQDQLVDRLEAVGGVESASWSRSIPFTYRSAGSAPVAVEGFITAPGEQPVVEFNQVGPAYLATMGIPLDFGREFTRADNETSLPVAMVNETMARRFWRGQDPVGRRIQVKGQWLQIVGVIKDWKNSSLLDPATPFFLTPLRQGGGGQTLEIRSHLSLAEMTRALSRQVKSIDPDLAPTELIPTREQINRMSWSHRASMNLLAVFSAIALLLAAIGLYGVMSYAVSQSTRELGLRMALGADASHLLRLVMSHGFRLMAAGTLLGAGAALLLTRLLGDLLYKVSPRDPASFGAAFAVMTIAALAACLAPALRATHTDPVKALRS